jgi:hypothetical protein
MPTHLARGEVIDAELEVAVDPRLRREAPVRLVVDDLVPAAGDPVHPVDHARESHTLDVDREAELQRGRDAVGRRRLAVVLREDLPAVLAIRPLLGRVDEARRDPRDLEHVVQLRQRGCDRHGTVVEQVERAVQRVPERERRRR